MPRCFGLDWGEKRTGVAVSDDRGTLAVGYDVWPTPELLSRLARAVREEGVEQIVVGYPLTLRGEAGRKARQVDRFIGELERAGYLVRRWDERYSTQDASRALTQIGVSQKKQRGRVDMSAAVLILQSYLDSVLHNGENDRGG
ncbi:Holliday junction resolvase RuvX [bacterium]|nr:Holliday junction resolvase RuvX [bacterium]MBU1983555.1 Holliday junction resolvase RuvX [bacterium]